MKKNTKKYAFNFVELLLVLMILGVVAALSFPILQNIKDDEDIYQAYMKKAIQDVSDASIMALIRNRYLTDYGRLGLMGHAKNGNYYPRNSLGIRYAFNTIINGVECGDCSGNANIPCREESCLSAQFPAQGSASATKPDTPGIIYGKSVMLFEYSHAVGVDDPAIPERFGFIMIDMNGNKGPNTMCQDRYRFLLHRNRAVLDTTTGCTLGI